MPNYDYICRECGYEFEAFQKMSDELLAECPSCKRATLKRIIGSGAGMIFKGSGFYLTDYKNKGNGNSSSVSSDNSSSTTEKTESTPSAAQTPNKTDTTTSST